MRIKQEDIHRTTKSVTVENDEGKLFRCLVTLTYEKSGILNIDISGSADRQVESYIVQTEINKHYEHSRNS